MQCCLFDKAYLILCALNPQAWQGNMANCSLDPSLMIISINRTHKCTVIAMYNHQHAVLAVGPTMFY